MSLNLPDTPGHPNKVPFSGILTRIGLPSDGAPGGSNGKRIILSLSAARMALSSLLGMAVDYVPSLDGHNPKAKIGIIDSAHIDADRILISGILYGADFPDLIAHLRAKTGQLGFSFEASEVQVADPKADPLLIEGCTFTGAAILRKDKAAYHSTTFSAACAHKETKMTHPIEAGSTSDVRRLRTTISDQDQAMVDLVKPHIVNLRSLADAMAQDGLGLDQASGHCAIIRALADDLEKTAKAGSCPDYFDLDSWCTGSDGQSDVGQIDEGQAVKGDRVVQSALRKGQGNFGTLSSQDQASITRNLRVAVRPLAQAGKIPVRRTMTYVSAAAQAGSAEMSAHSIGAFMDEPRSLAEWDRILADMPTAQRIELKVSLRKRNLIA
jgi:hypothetical protein